MKSPLSGEVVEVNPLLAERPETVHADPYGAGWLVRLRPMRLDSERAALLQGDAAPPAMAAHARLFQVE